MFLNFFKTYIFGISVNIPLFTSLFSLPSFNLTWTETSRHTRVQGRGGCVDPRSSSTSWKRASPFRAVNLLSMYTVSTGSLRTESELIIYVLIDLFNGNGENRFNNRFNLINGLYAFYLLSYLN